MIAAHQPVFSEFPEIKAARVLAEIGDFFVVGYNSGLQQICAMKASAQAAGVMRMFRVCTDKGNFDLAEGQLVRLSSGEYVPVEHLKAGMSLHAASIDSSEGYVRVHLQNRRKGKEFMHRLVATQMGWDLKLRVVHHRDENKLNNRSENLEVTTQSAHAAHHGKKSAENGEHVFQKKQFPHEGAKNGMHSSSPFWKDSAKSMSYRETQGRLLKSSGKASSMQVEAVLQKRCNNAHKILNSGHPIDTFEQYYEGWKAVFGRAGHSKAHMKGAIDAAFGSHEEFVKEVARRNHRVISVEEVGVADSYAVAVQLAAGSEAGEVANLLIMPVDVKSPVGSGILVASEAPGIHPQNA